MRQSIKIDRELEKVKKLLEAQGLDTSALDEVKQSVPEEVENEADAVLLYIDTAGKHFTEKACPQCGKRFATTNPKIVGRCSNACRAASLREVGIVWNPYKSAKERWGRYVPLTVPPEALDIIKIEA